MGKRKQISAEERASRASLFDIVPPSGQSYFDAHDFNRQFFDGEDFHDTALFLAFYNRIDELRKELTRVNRKRKKFLLQLEEMKKTLRENGYETDFALYDKYPFPAHVKRAKEEMKCLYLSAVMCSNVQRLMNAAHERENGMSVVPKHYPGGTWDVIRLTQEYPGKESVVHTDSIVTKWGPGYDREGWWGPKNRAEAHDITCHCLPRTITTAIDILFTGSEIEIKDPYNTFWSIFWNGSTTGFSRTGMVSELLFPECHKFNYAGGGIRDNRCLLERIEWVPGEKTVDIMIEWLDGKGNRRNQR